MILDFLPDRLLNAIKNVDLDKLNEIRIRVNNPIYVLYDFKKYYLSNLGLTLIKEKSFIAKKEEIVEIISNVTDKSLYAHNDRLKNAYLITKDKVRLGICGECVFDNEVKTIKNISSILIRVPLLYDIKNFDVIKHIKEKNDILNTLIISPPGFGKTTMIKNIIKDISIDYEVLVFDERGELFDENINADYLRFSPKDFSFEKGIRVMSPNVIVMDEIITKNDFQMCYKTVNSGIKVIATIHSKSLEDVKSKEYYIDNIFDRYVLLKNKQKAGEIDCIYDRHNNVVYE